MKYLDAIKQSLTDFYCNDLTLLDPSRKTHEQTISFRLSFYLAKHLENEKFFVDCEYHGDVNNETKRKELWDPKTKQFIHVRPDIIYHDRYKDNQFCIEIKLLSPRKDRDKVKSFIKANLYNEGYCLHNFKKTGCNLTLFYKDGNSKVVDEKKAFRYPELRLINR